MDINYIKDYITKNYPDSCVAVNYGNSTYVDPEELENFFYYEKLDWCGCGDPDSAKITVRDFLWALHVDIGSWEKREERFHEKFGVKDVYGNNLLLCLAYTLDAAELTEHGSSIGGAWLTEEGKMFLWLLEQNEDLKENKNDL